MHVVLYCYAILLLMESAQITTTIQLVVSFILSPKWVAEAPGPRGVC